MTEMIVIALAMELGIAATIAMRQASPADGISFEKECVLFRLEEVGHPAQRPFLHLSDGSFKGRWRPFRSTEYCVSRRNTSKWTRWLLYFAVNGIECQARTTGIQFHPLQYKHGATAMQMQSHCNAKSAVTGALARPTLIARLHIAFAAPSCRTCLHWSWAPRR
jgi:hypothetical protein